MSLFSQMPYEKKLKTVIKLLEDLKMEGPLMPGNIPCCLDYTAILKTMEYIRLAIIQKERLRAHMQSNVIEYLRAAIDTKTGEVIDSVILESLDQTMEKLKGMENKPLQSWRKPWKNR